MSAHRKDSIGFGEKGEETLHEFEIEGKTAIVEFRLFELEIGWQNAVCNTVRTVFDDPSGVTSTRKSPDAGLEQATP